MKRANRKAATAADTATKSTTLLSQTRKVSSNRIHNFLRWYAFIIFIVLLVGWQIFLDNNDAQEIHTESKQNHLIRQRRRDKQSLQNQDNQSLQSQDKQPLDNVVEYLTKLAIMPSNKLQRALNSEEDDVFQLSQLEKGNCPSNMQNWLPPRVSDEAARLFRERNKPQHHNNNPNKNKPLPLLWYEHLSKAGGTSFCKLAGTNMFRSEVPSYYCMPSKKDDPDARVGLWSNDELAKYVQDGTKRIVSNEWNPFDPIRFDFQSENSKNPNIKVMFVTTIREPINRLLSAYKFWGVLHNQMNPHPTITQWLNRQHNRARHASVPDWEITNHVSRYNFAAWKFSNGKMPLPKPEVIDESVVPPSVINYESESSWREPFSDAIRNLSRFDLVIPLELLWKPEHSILLKDVLGWDKLDEVHVVPTGKVEKTDAKAKVSPEQYEVLWNANRLDMILHAWSKALFLSKIHCGNNG